MIERLVIHRFRGIREGLLEGLGKVNLLIGPNNSGKTAILEMLYLSGVSGRPCALITETLEKGVFSSATLVRNDFLGYEPLPRLNQRHGHKALWKESPATLTVEGGLAVSLHELPDEHPLRDFRLGAPLDELGHKDNKVFYKKDIGAVALFSLVGQQGTPPAMIPRFFETQGVRSEETRWCYLWQPEWVHRWEPEAPLDKLAVWAEAGIPADPHHVLLFDFHVANDHFTEQFAQWAKETIPDWYNKIAERLAGVFPELHGAEVEIDNAPDGQKGESGYLRFQARTRLSVDHFGDGTRHAFKVLASLIALAEEVSDERPGLLLWEDPELFMHPATLGRLLDEVARVIGGKPIQLVMSTQSLEVLAWLAHCLEQIPLPIAPEQVRTFRLGLEEGRLGAQAFPGKALGRWLEYFGDPRVAGEDELHSPLFHLLKECGCS